MFFLEESIICNLTSCKHNQDVLELKEEELLVVHNKIQQTVSDVLTLTILSYRRINRNFC